MLVKLAIIRKVGPNRYCVYSKKKGPNGKRKRMGCGSHAYAKKRIRQIEYFKHATVLFRGAVYVTM